MTHKMNYNRSLREVLVRKPGVGISNKPKTDFVSRSGGVQKPDTGITKK
jgi:hypothetical protein